MDEDSEYKVIAVPLPEEAAMVYASVGVVGYVREDGTYGYSVRATGESSPSTTYLGLLYKAMRHVDEWGDVSGDS